MIRIVIFFADKMTNRQVKKWMTTMKTWAIQAYMDRKCASFLLVFLMLLIGQTPLISWIFVFAMFSVEYRFFKDYFKASSNTVDLQAICLIYINDVKCFNFFLLCAMFGASGRSLFVFYLVLFSFFYLFFFLVTEGASFSVDRNGRFVFVIVLLALGAMIISFFARYISSQAIKTMVSHFVFSSYANYRFLFVF